MMRSCIGGSVVAVMLPFALLAGCGSAPLVTKIHNEEAFKSLTSMAIQDFSGRDSAVRYSGNVDSLGRVMAMYVEKELKGRQTRLSVSLVGGEAAGADVVVEGRFTSLDEGDPAARVFVGVGGVEIAVAGVIKRPDGTVIAEFSSSKSSSGGPLGMGGILAADSGRIIDGLMEDIAADLADFILGHVAQK